MQARAVRLVKRPGVWYPTPNGLFYAEALDVAPGERVIDIGTGSGVLAIWAALKGANVFATDTNECAVEVARESAAENGVAINVERGALFGPWRETYDVVFANLPNEWVAPEYVLGLEPATAEQFVGGEGGNRQLLALLDEVPHYVHPGSRLYLPVHSLTDYRQTLTRAREIMDLVLIMERELPAKPFVSAHWDFYAPLVEAGIIDVRRRGDAFFTVGYVYCGTPRDSNHSGGT